MKCREDNSFAYCLLAWSLLAVALIPPAAAESGGGQLGPASSVVWQTDAAGINRDVSPSCDLLFELRYGRLPQPAEAHYPAWLSVRSPASECRRVYVAIVLADQYYFLPRGSAAPDYIQFCFRACKEYDWPVLDTTMDRLAGARIFAALTDMTGDLIEWTALDF